MSNVIEILDEANRTGKYPICPFCNERNGFVLVGEHFVCGVCIGKARERFKQEYESKIVAEVKRQIMEELKKE